jgi:hypothetical protein
MFSKCVDRNNSISLCVLYGYVAMHLKSIISAFQTECSKILTARTVSTKSHINVLISMFYLRLYDEHESTINIEDFILHTDSSNTLCR